jgi:hypothetical protein
MTDVELMPSAYVLDQKTALRSLDNFRPRGLSLTPFLRSPNSFQSHSEKSHFDTKIIPYYQAVTRFHYETCFKPIGP